MINPSDYFGVGGAVGRWRNVQSSHREVLLTPLPPINKLSPCFPGLSIFLRSPPTDTHVYQLRPNERTYAGGQRGDTEEGTRGISAAPIVISQQPSRAQPPSNRETPSPHRPTASTPNIPQRRRKPFSRALYNVGMFFK